ncbi:MAG: hypothetical protein IT214_07370 [Chitinophagaceae bacterium]|nr:hypothetical protein [Chitinophagaceae bacterium]
MKKLYILSFCLCLCFCSNGQEGSQADSSHFLWFKGHWSKTQKNTFITGATIDSLEGGVIKIAGGTSVTISSDGGININSPGIDDWNKRIDDRGNDLDKFIQQLKSGSDQKTEWAYHFSQASLPFLEDIKKQWDELKLDNKENPLNSGSEKTPNETTADIVANLCRKIQPDYNEVISFYQAHKKDNSSSYHNPAPPEHDYHCFNCNKDDLQKKYYIEDSVYASNFFKPESDLLRKAFSIQRDLALSGLDKDVYNPNDPEGQIIDQLFHRDKNNPSKSGACAYLDRTQLANAIQFIGMREYWRAYKLLNDNKNNFKAASAVIRTFLEAVRQLKLMGIDVDSKFPVLANLLYNEFEYFYNKLTRDHDWSQLANIPFIFGLYRNYLLFGVGSEEDAMIKGISKLLNSFYINLELDIEVGNGSGRMLTHLKGKAKVAPEYHYGTDSCYAWVVVSDQPSVDGRPVKKGDQKIEMDLLANEIITGQYRPSYIGTKKYFTELNSLKLNYCKDGSDSIMLSQLIPEPDAMAGIWVYPPSGQKVPSGINQLDITYFRSVSQLQADAQSGAIQQSAEEYKKQAEEAMAQAKKFQNQMGNGQINMSQIGNYQKLMDKMNILRAGGNNVMGRIMNISFPLKEKQNNSKTLFKKRFDAKEINQDSKIRDMILYGYYTVNIEYAPEKK